MDQLLRPVLQLGSLPDPATHRPYSGSMGASEVQIPATPSAANSALDRSRCAATTIAVSPTGGFCRGAAGPWEPGGESLTSGSASAQGCASLARLTSLAERQKANIIRQRAASSPRTDMSDNEKRGEEGLGTGVFVKATPKTKAKMKKPSMYKVLMLNDDCTPMESVVHILGRFFNKNRPEATRIILDVHRRRSGVWRIHLRSGRGQGNPSHGLRQAAPASSAVHAGKGLVPELSPPKWQGRIGGRVVTQSRKVAASGSCLCQ